MGAPEVIARICVGGVGAWLAGATFLAAVRTTVLPRGIPSRLTRGVATLVRWLFLLRLGRAASYERRDRIFAGYAPATLLATLQAWLLGVLVGFAGLHWATVPGEQSVRRAVAISGSSIFTLGYAVPRGAAETTVTFFEASIGLVLVALLISYLPAIYGAFSRREAMVARIQVRAGEPPTGTEVLRRAWAIDRLDFLEQMWAEMEVWFTELQETHTSFPALVHFRSPQPMLSWVTAAGAVLDGAALLTSTVDVPARAEPQLCLRAGSLALREVAAFYRVPFDPDPAASDPITVTWAEWEAAADELAAAGVPVVGDRDQAWADFAGWRVNYDTVLVALAALTMAPWAPWSSDRSLAPAARRGRRPRG